MGKNPNRHARATVLNDWGSTIKNIKLQHRYDNDHYDHGEWDSLHNQDSGDNISIGYWTGFLRIGLDYWSISFEADGRVWTCKDNFYCYLKRKDAEKLIVCRVYKDGNHAKMEIKCPGSSNCTVPLESAVQKPTNWAFAGIRNDCFFPLKKVALQHRYNNDHFDVIRNDQINSGELGSTTKIGYWTGAFKTGLDYWLISFEANGRIWRSPPDFDCHLTSADTLKKVTCRIYQDKNDIKMEIICPESLNCITTLQSYQIPDQETRPLYIMAHRCNDPGDIGIAIHKGCNALECDIQFDQKTKEIYVHHDFPSGANIYEWINNAKVIAESYPKRFALIIFDCKFANSDKDKTGSILLKLRNIVRENLNDHLAVPINIIFSIAYFKNHRAFDKIIDDLDPNEGIAIDQSDKSDLLAQYYKRNNIQNGWFANGISSIVPKDVFESIEAGCILRDQNETIKKVYVWTLAKKSSIKEFVDIAKVDGVMINVPGTLFHIPGIFALQEAQEVVYESAHVHFATRADNAFSVYKKILEPHIVSN